MGQRFPFTSFPNGWYVIGFSSDIAPGELSTVHYFGRDIVLFRTTSGVLSALDKTCPHLGAHLGGGRVDGECIRCPFHAWAFDSAGHCVDVPYAPRIPPRARAQTWPILEQNGVILVHYAADPMGRRAKDGDCLLDERPPAWVPPVLEEEGWTPNRTIRWEIRSHPQEVGENTVDCSHLGPVHHVKKTEVLEVEQNAHVMRVLLHLVATGHVIGMPDELNDVHLDVTLHGLGMIVSQTHVITGGMRTRQRIHPTPIDGDRIAIFAVANTKEMLDAGYTKEIDDIFWQAFTDDFAKDFPIWENKAYLERPLLAGGDGPIGSYRRWARQFYVAGQSEQRSDLERTNARHDDPKAASDRIDPTTARSSAVPGLGSVEAALARWGGAPSQALQTLLIGRARLVRFVDRLRGASTEVRDDAAHEESPPEDGTHDDGLPKTASPRPPSENHEAHTKGSSKKRFPSVDSYFDSLEARFDPSAAGELEAVFQWILTDDRTLDHFAEVSGGKIQTAAGVHAAPTVSIEMSANDYLQMINGELNGALAFSTGRGRLRGPVRLAMRMQRIFPLEVPA